MAEISQSVNIEMLEKLADGNYKLKYPLVIPGGTLPLLFGGGI